jgi:hypothetical protein
VIEKLALSAAPTLTGTIIITIISAARKAEKNFFIKNLSFYKL